MKLDSTIASQGHPGGTVSANETGPPLPGRIADAGEMVVVHIVGDDMLIFVTNPVE
jgi:hypothetical protein